MVMAEIKILPWWMLTGVGSYLQFEFMWRGSLESEKYTILQKTIPISLILDSQDSKSTIHKIVKVCCAFVNLCPSVVPQEYCYLMLSFI